MRNYVSNTIAYGGQVRIYVARTTNMVERAREIHDTWPTATAALGRMITASIMMSMMHNPDDRITLTIQGDGPIERMIVDTNYDTLRADILQPSVYLVYEDGINKGKLNVGAAVGNGLLSVTKTLKNLKPFNSSVRLQTGEIGDDFTFYYTVSEQIPSSIGLGVLVNPDKTVRLAAGFMVQVLPGCEDSIIDDLENNIKKVGSLTNYLSNHTTEELLTLLSGGTYKLLEETEVRYECDCSWESFYNHISSLDLNTLKELAEDSKDTEVVCHFCKKKYYYKKDDLNKMIENKRSNSGKL